MSGRDLARLAEQRGWVLLRIKGSHHIYSKAGERNRLTIPVHGNRPLGPGLQRHLMQIVGIAEHEL